MKIKKLFAVLSCTLGMLGLTGCSVTMNVEGLNKYVSTSPSTVKGVGTTLNESIETNIAHLNSVYNTFSELDNVLNSAASFNLKGYIDAMYAWSGPVLARTNLMENNQVTPVGNAILSSIVLDKDAIAHTITDDIPEVLAKLYQNRIQGNSSASNQYLNLDGSTTPATDSSDVNRFLTLFGYQVEKIQLLAYYDGADFGGDKLSTTYNAFCDNKEYNKFNQFTTDVTFSCEGNTSSKMYELYVPAVNNTFDLGDGANKNPVSVSKNGPNDTARVHLPLCPPTQDQVDSAFASLKSEKGEKITAAEFATWADAHPNHLGVLMHYAGCIEIIDSSENPTNRHIYWNEADAVNGVMTTAYPIAKVWRIGVWKDGEVDIEDLINCTYLRPSNTPFVYLFVKQKIKYYGTDGKGHLDIRTVATATDSSKTPYSSLPTDMSLFSSTAYSQFASMAYMSNDDIVNTLRPYSNGKVLALNPDLDMGKFPDMSAFNMTNYTGGTLLSSGDFTPVKDSSNRDITLNLLDNISGDVTETKETPLYIGSTKIGNLYTHIITSDICDDVMAAVITDNGARKNQPIQRFKYYHDSVADQTYIVYGLSDIGYIYYISAADVAEGVHKYTPTIHNSQMMFNIFDKQIYLSGNNNNVSKFDETSNVKLYTSTGSDIAVTTRSHSVKSKYSAQFINVKQDDGTINSTMSKIAGAIEKRRTPFVLKTYLEGLYVPDAAGNDTFACLGRRIVFNKAWFDKNIDINETTSAFTVVTPQGDNQADETSAHTVGDLISSKTHTTVYNETILNNGAEDHISTEVQGIGKLRYLTYTDEIRTKEGLGVYGNVNTIYVGTIYAGEFKTSTDYIKTDGRLASHCQGTYEHYKIKTPRLFVWCTASDVNNGLAAYVESAQFGYWSSWLQANGYSNYLGDMSAEDFTDELTYKLEYIYDISLDAKKGSTGILVDTSGLDVLDDWIKDKDEKTDVAILDVTMITLGIILLSYGTLLLAAYIIDVGVVGEGDGLLKKVTFNRMKSVTGMSKEERKQLTAQSEKGTYTIRAVSFGEVFFVVLIIWAVATIVLVGASYDIIDKLLEIAEQITSIVKGTLKRN